VEFVVISNSREMAVEEEQNLGIQDLRLSPNPTNETLKIQYFSKENTLPEPIFEIVNTLGISILTSKLDKESEQFFTKEINVKDLMTGMYFVRIINGEKVFVKRFVKTD
jgi:hypothetical protein